jgi:hypothetical protein
MQKNRKKKAVQGKENKGCRKRAGILNANSVTKIFSIIIPCTFKMRQEKDVLKYFFTALTN